MLSRTEIALSKLPLSKPQRETLLSHCDTVIAAYETALGIDFGRAKYLLKIRRCSPLYAWSFGDTVDFEKNGIVNIDLFAYAPQVLLTPSFITNWLDQTLSHESYHVGQKRHDPDGYGLTLGEAIASEGRAVRFQEEFTGVMPWVRWPAPPTSFPRFVVRPMLPPQRQRFARKIGAELSTPVDITRDARLFGDKRNWDQPYLCGYTFGDWLFGHYQHAHKTTAAQCVALSGSTVIDWFLHEAPPPVRRGIGEPPAAVCGVK